MVSAAGPPPNIERLRVPVALRPTVAAIVAVTDAFCVQHLDGEYGGLCRSLVARLARKRPPPLARGDAGI